MRVWIASLLLLGLGCSACRICPPRRGFCRAVAAERQQATDASAYIAWVVHYYARARLMGPPYGQEELDKLREIVRGDIRIGDVDTPDVARIVREHGLHPEALFADLTRRSETPILYDEVTPEVERLLDWEGREQEAPRYWQEMDRLFRTPEGIDKMFPDFQAKFQRDWRYRVQLLFGLSFLPAQHTYELEGEHRVRIGGPLYIHEAYERWLDALRDGERLLLEGAVQ